jgi:hypothetical protein
MDEKLKMLSAELPKDAIQKTVKSETKKGYDTTGYSYQYVVDRLNEVYGLSWGFKWEILERKDGNFRSGAPFVEITVMMSIWVESEKNIRTCVGGHISSNYADALKGAITNSFKKTAAFFGVGASAFRGTLDDDSVMPDTHENKTYQKVQNAINNISELDEVMTNFILLIASIQEAGHQLEDKDFTNFKTMENLYTAKNPKLKVENVQNAIKYFSEKYKGVK